MTNRRHNSAIGFTLVEVMVTGALVAVAIAGVMGGIRSISRADSQAVDAELVQRLAQDKIEDVKLLSDPTDIGAQGDFSDRGYPDVTWTSNVTTTSIANVDQVTIIATRGNVSQSLTTEIYVVPISSTTTTTSTTGTGQ